MRSSFLLVSLLLVSVLGSAQAAFRDMIWGARPAGLGGAYAALSDDASGPLYNPAGTARSTRPQASLSYASLFAGLKLYAGQETTSVDLGSLSFVDQRRRWGTIGAFWNAYQAKGVYREDTMGLSWGGSFERWGDGFSVGGAVKMLRHAYDVDPLTAQDPVFQAGRAKSAVGVDLGLQWEPFVERYPGLRLGLVGRNLNAPDVGLSEKDRVPTDVRLGVALEKTHLLIFSPVLELSFRAGRTELSGGLEKWFMRDALAFRLGGGAREVTGGFSYRFGFAGAEDRSLQVDYALSWPLYMDDTTGTHRLSLAVRFGGEPAPKSPQRFSQIRKSYVLGFPNEVRR